MNTFAHQQRGQGMTEYIIIVALIAIAAIGIYQAFGDIVRGQTSIAASALAGRDSGGAADLVDEAQGRSNTTGQRAVTLQDFQEDAGT
jgi:type IV pilus assembly protein PilA